MEVFLVLLVVSAVLAVSWYGGCRRFRQRVNRLRILEGGLRKGLIIATSSYEELQETERLCRELKKEVGHVSIGVAKKTT